MHPQSSFVTLTYDKKHLPDDLSLDIEEWISFRKALRKRIGAFRYFMAGEYGEELKRPHYHAIIFGEDFASDRYSVGSRSGKPLYSSPRLEAAWKRGYVSIGSVTPQSAAYVAKYSLKKVDDPVGCDPSEFVERYGRWDKETGEFWTVKPEFATMSRRPGLGASWIDRYKDDVWPDDRVTLRGREYGVPRYYVDRALSEDERAQVAAKRADYLEASSGELEPARLDVRERCAKALLAHNTRRAL